MTTREVEGRSSGVNSTSGPALSQCPPPPSNTSITLNNSAPGASTTNVNLDIGAFVLKYNRLRDQLDPLSYVGNAILYVIRWESYLLTLVVLSILCVLFYFPALLAGSAVASAIAGMAVGKYYGQTKLNFLLLRKRETPQIELLDEETEILKKHKKDEKTAHRLLLEYREIMYSAESSIESITKALEYLNRILFWKSLEVSLCITVLLCVLFMLLCTVYLRVLSASLPLLVLCFNKYFLRRTVELWKMLFSYVFQKIRPKRKICDNDHKHVEVYHHKDPLLQEQSSELASIASNDSDEGQSTGTSGAVGQGSTSGTKSPGPNEGATGNRETLFPSLSSKGFCTKCNASFAKLLKRKHDCNYCGQTYCGSCTVRVKRAELGATSPAAFEESVRVCLDCKQRLDDMKQTS